MYIPSNGPKFKQLAIDLIKANIEDVSKSIVIKKDEDGTERMIVNTGIEPGAPRPYFYVVRYLARGAIIKNYTVEFFCKKKGSPSGNHSIIKITLTPFVKDITRIISAFVTEYESGKVICTSRVPIDTMVHKD